MGLPSFSSFGPLAARRCAASCEESPAAVEAELGQHLLGRLAVPGFALRLCGDVTQLDHSLTSRSRKVLLMTETELRLIVWRRQLSG